MNNFVFPSGMGFVSEWPYFFKLESVFILVKKNIPQNVTQLLQELLKRALDPKIETVFSQI